MLQHLKEKSNYPESRLVVSWSATLLTSKLTRWTSRSSTVTISVAKPWPITLKPWWSTAKPGNYRGRSPGGPPMGRPRGLADFFSVAGTISDGRLRNFDRKQKASIDADRGRENTMAAGRRLGKL
ncbi:hypothetical protein H5410_011305 [Solanum commersonii]|uniref:Uncharacterized protein n=1 Tax=Solanum commersonii TaxID=4109 RepID=A0A9J6APS4_SOLCO|nr:hypothetical protein H5410_011305 [Solanum commersonii]